MPTVDFLLLTPVFLCEFLQTRFLRTLSEASATEPFTEEMPQEVNQDTHESREER